MKGHIGLWPAAPSQAQAWARPNTALKGIALPSPRFSVWALAALSLFLIVQAACRGEAGNAETRPAAEAARPVAVVGASDVAVAKKTDIISGVPVSGSLQPAVDIRMASPIPEVVEDVLVREGDAVKKGQVLARFRATSLTPAAASAEAQRRVSAADYERMKNLFAEGAVSQKDVENAELALRSAEAADALARSRVDEATMRASIAGVIARRMVDAGDRVKDGDQMFQLVNTDELEFEATVPAQYAGDVRVGAPVALVVTGLSGPAVSGKVSRVNSSVDPATRQLKVYVTVSNPGHRLVGGLFASGRVVLKEARAAIAVPQPGLKTDEAGKTYVFVVDNGRVARRDVTVGVFDEAQNMYQIVTGLSGGEAVIVGPVEGLRAGDQIQLVGREG